MPEHRPGAWPDLDMLAVHEDGGHLAQPPALGPDVGHFRAQSYCLSANEIQDIGF